MKLFRIASRDFPVFDGTGARLHGGRWNSPGSRIIYASLNISCARLEVMAHRGLTKMPRNHGFVLITVPRGIKPEAVRPETLPADWNSLTRIDIAQAIGDAWIRRAASLLLQVPSVASPHDFNVLINQDHPDFHQITASVPLDLEWDKRHFGPP